MEVYRITLKKWSKSLKGSGYPGRWNSKGVFVIYSTGSRALASLENLVHRSGEGLNNLFAVMRICVPDQLSILELEQSELPQYWFDYENYQPCQKIGDKWIEDGEYPILKVPSAIIRKEYNYLINPNHPQFHLIEIIEVEEFEFDLRLIRP